MAHGAVVRRLRLHGAHFHVHRIEAARVEQHRFTDGKIGEVEQQVEALGGGEEGLAAGLRRRQQAAVVADERERQGRARRGAPAKAVGAGVGRVENAEPIQPRGHVQIRAGGTVDVNRVAEVAVHLVHGRGGVIGAASILQEQRNLAFARHKVQGCAQFGFVVVADLECAEQAAIRLAGRQSVGMRVIPVQSASVTHLEIVGIASSGRGQGHAGAVVTGVDRQPMPVHDRCFIKAVVELDAHALSRPQHERRIDELAAVIAREVTLGQAAAGGNARGQRRGAQGERLLV